MYNTNTDICIFQNKVLILTILNVRLKPRQRLEIHLECLAGFPGCSHCRPASIVLLSRVQEVGAAYALLNIPASELVSMNDTDYPPALMHLLTQLHDELAQANSFQQRVEIADKALIKLLCQSRLCIPSSLMAGVRWLCASEGGDTIKRLTQQINLSQRQLERQFQQHLGLSPKHFSRISRVGKARCIIKQSPSTTLAEVALSSGFFDQSHFHRDFTRVVGMSPNQYRKRQLNQNL